MTRHPSLNPEYLDRLRRLGALLDDISNQLGAYGADLEPFVEAARCYLDAVVEEAAARRIEYRFKSVKEYSDLRLRSSGVGPCIELGLVVEACGVTEALRASEPFQRAFAACNLNCSYVNDLVSYEKELAEGECFNLVCALQCAEGLSRNNAVQQAHAYIASTVEDYVVARDEMLDVLPEAQRSAQLMENWMSGNLKWSLSATNRYAVGTSCYPG